MRANRRCRTVRKNMAEQDPNAKWDDIPGFNGQTGEYVRLDTDGWLKAHRIREEARKLGSDNFPREDQTDFDEIHYKVLDWINQRARQCKQDVDKYLMDQMSMLNGIEEDEDLETCKDEADQIANAATIEFGEQAQEGQNALNPIKADLRNGWREYVKFRQWNHLERLAQDTDVVTAVLWVLILFFVETVLNASLLMEVNPFGLVGAAIQMGLITGINILIGFLGVGRIFRYVNHVNTGKRLAGWLAGGSLTALIMGFNVAVGHFRDSMQAMVARAEIDPIAMLENDAISRLLEEPFGFDAFQTILLVLTGILFFTIASWKGYRWDDPYPGYGPRTRKLESLKAVYAKRRKAAVQAARTCQEDAIHKLKDLQYKTKLKNDRWDELVERGRQVARNYITHMHQYQHDLNYLIAVYRSENRQTRTDPEPVFFSQPMQIDSMIMESPEFAPHEKISTRNLMEHIHDKVTEVQKSYNEEVLRRIYPTLEDIGTEAEGEG